MKSVVICLGVFCVILCVGVVNGDLNFMVMGDWGGQASWPYYTLGEAFVAKSMDSYANLYDSKFVLGLGDNMYSTGVTSEYDARFKETFEDVFTGDNLKNMPFHFLAGNHDHYGNVTGELYYSNHSSRWRFPSLYYTWTTSVGNGQTVQFVMIDTVVLVGNSLDNEMQIPAGPADQGAADKQWQWIEEVLAASTADYLIVSGHYPVYSICEHGPTSLLVDQLKPLLEKYNVTEYFCGHDHCVEYLNDGSNVDYHVIGASHLCDSSTSHKDSVPPHSLKFHWASGLGAFAGVNITTDGLVVSQYDTSLNLLYSAPARPSRRQHANTKSANA